MGGLRLGSWCRGALGALKRIHETILLGRAAVEPIRAPDPVNAPAAGFEDLLADAIAIARRAGGVIGRPVTLDPEEVARSVLGTQDAQVDIETRHADLWVNLISACRQK